MRRARGVVGRYGAQASVAACDRRARTALTALTGSCQAHTRHITSHAGKFVRSIQRHSRPSSAVSAWMPGRQHVQSGVCLYAWAAARQHGSTAARQRGSAAARQRGSAAARQRGSTAARQRGSAAARQHGSTRAFYRLYRCFLAVSAGVRLV
jgi:hypothetical protein